MHVHQHQHRTHIVTALSSRTLSVDYHRISHQIMGFLLGFPGMTLLTAGPCRITIRPGTPREDDNSRGIKDPITFEHQSIFLVAQASSGRLLRRRWRLFHFLIVFRPDHLFAPSLECRIPVRPLKFARKDSVKFLMDQTLLLAATTIIIYRASTTLPPWYIEFMLSKDPTCR